MPIPLLMAAGAAISGVNAIIANNKSNSAKIDSQNYENRIIELENNRQEIINPYAGVSDLSSMLKNPYADMNNPYANLRVSTKAAEMQAEQSDIALANTLDTLRATGSSAGGATALAQAALKSKQGISADIEKQESANEKLRAKGEFELQALKAKGEGDLQSARMSEAARVQQAQVSGQQFMYSQQEARDLQQLDRAQQMYDTSQEQQLQYQTDMMSSIGNLAGGLGGIGELYSFKDGSLSLDDN